MKKEIDIWRWIERLVLLGTIAGVWYHNKIDKVTWRAKVDINMEHLIQSDAKREGYWTNQLEFNGTVNEYIRNSNHSSGPTQEETEGN